MDKIHDNVSSDRLVKLYDLYRGHRHILWLIGFKLDEKIVYAFS